MFKLGHGWVITSHITKRMKLLIHAQRMNHARKKNTHFSHHLWFFFSLTIFFFQWIEGVHSITRAYSSWIIIRSSQSGTVTTWSSISWYYIEQCSIVRWIQKKHQSEFKLTKTSDVAFCMRNMKLTGIAFSVLLNKVLTNETKRYIYNISLHI